MIYPSTITKDIDEDIIITSVLKNISYILYTCPRAEKAAYRELTYREYEVFLPYFGVYKTLKIIF